ncbi:MULTISPECIES: PLP-dependent aminotransferase family protein [unclassified Paenibacillus]|uniref:aminotransferase-like domain-containing protein n=1 Tax=unclassified Paenibacillus TaxID=185978 RepID=UPI000956F5CB|nr:MULTISPECIES: PLP-dependent aminotransferase family protein [unclassified Paenibacillus]ASS68414.1 PLP-dependent aminotransferase family protein [Paenibacillus sp. RUD330]SIR32373.1 DNA-binding transcriptional regulator, MocR family, contains an aminotransferase domain [Paenibacillus sp. RU4X]SIR43664.1 DNA-binding transcriptional regulator, MocR family, contains an aminotransferase domain [Paenibacillus sp. RU4T]
MNNSTSIPVQNGVELIKYEHVRDDLKQRIRSGSIKPGGKLPSIRELSAQWACSKNTVIRAIEELQKEHLIYSIPKSGHYAIVRTSKSEERSEGRIDFAAAAPDPGIIPYEEIQHGLNRAVQLYGDHLFTYGDPLGIPSLRKAISQHLAFSQIFAEPERISVVSGSQQALHLLASMPFPNGKSAILVEQPCYSGMLKIMNLLGATAIGMARTESGLDLDELERHFRNNSIKFFYTVPRYHNPLGTSLSRREKEAIASMAEKYDVYIVEDDYLADLETDSKSDPICSYDRSGRVIYIRSFSKIMLPGLRLGVAVLPEALVPLFRLYKSSSDLSTATLSQAVLEIHLGSGLFQRHAALMRERYGNRMQALREACSRYLNEGFRLSRPAGGIFARLELPGHLAAEELAAALRQKDVHVFPTMVCYLPSVDSANGWRLSIIRTNEQEIEDGIRIIRQTADELTSPRRASKPGRSAITWI